MINLNYNNLQESYLFHDISQRVEAYKKNNSDKSIIRLGIGDVTLPLVPEVIRAMQNAVAEMGVKESFKGYQEAPGCDFLCNAIKAYYLNKGVKLEDGEIFISDGAKSDVGNILDIFARDIKVLVPDPVYPVYVDTNIMDGREIIYADGNPENDFLPLPNESVHADLIYLCSPNNPTGAVYNKAQLKKWIDYANNHKAIILFDSAYEAYVNAEQNQDLPTSIYEIAGAETCAIEFCSLSKTAGFTGTRCGYTIVPHKLIRDELSLNKLWLRRQTTKYNQTSYIIQRGAAAVFTPEGQKQVKENISYYMNNASIIANALKDLNIWFTGGANSPYIWLKCPNGKSSWEFFDYLLEKANVVGTPGAGFGKNGEGFFRLTAFGSVENTRLAVERIRENV